MDHKVAATGIEALQDMRSIIRTKSYEAWTSDDVKYGVYQEIYALINAEIDKKILALCEGV
jgi:hypothetical protein